MTGFPIFQHTLLLCARSPPHVTSNTMFHQEEEKHQKLLILVILKLLKLHGVCGCVSHAIDSGEVQWICWWETLQETSPDDLI